jgi:gamma-glutamyltranspeptidase/glutathione hydrolase
VTPVIAGDWESTAGILARDEGARATFLVADGEERRAPRAGEWFRNPDYGRTLRAIARDGPKVLYDGPLGERIVEHVGRLGGFLTMADLRANQPTWVTPISVDFQGYRVWELPPNNQGIAALEMLKILEPYDLASLGHNSAAYLHLLIEAKKLAYADLARYVGDADHLSVPPGHLLSPRFIESRRRLIDSAHAAIRVEPGPAQTASETIYLTVADRQGNMVSFINSLFDEFGSGVVVPGTGFALHDRGAGFALTAGLPNTVAPGKRPFHTLIPGFVTKPAPRPTADGAGDTPYMSFGLMGGAMQAQGHAQLLLNLFVFGMDVQQAIDAPRFRHLSGARVALESPIGGAVRERLRQLGHDLSTPRDNPFGGSQVIVRLPRGYVAGSDPRKDGHAAGY